MTTATTARLTHPSRSGLLDELGYDRYDVVIVGGGITGAGAARDAALRGLKVALVEAHDFAHGTSSRSSKLIHGGLRYLAMGDVALVRETALERKAVHAMAPHLAEPCWMVVPARNRATMAKFRTGIATYEKLGAVEDGDRHRNWGRDDLATEEPHLRRDTYSHAVAYREYLTDDARLVVGVLRDAVRGGAVVANRLPVVDVVRDGDRVDGVVARCGLTGTEVTIRADVVVNAAGPWVERLAAMEAPRDRDRLHPSRGIHVVLDAARLPVRNLVIMTAADKRSIFAIPRGDTVYLGTTDTSYDGDSMLWPEIEAHDVDYLLEPLARIFDVDPPTRDDVLAAWAGVRPLVAQEGKDAKELSRKDEIWVGSGGMVTIAGGKLTGFRTMATTVIDTVAERLGRTLPDAPAPDPVPGGETGRDLDAHAAAVSSRTGADRRITDRLVRLYGSDADAVLALGSAPLADGATVVAGEVTWAIDVEAATDLEDVLYRRTRAAWYTPAERDALVEPAAAIIADRLGWDDATTAEQVAAVRRRFADELAFQESP